MKYNYLFLVLITLFSSCEKKKDVSEVVKSESLISPAKGNYKLDISKSTLSWIGKEITTKTHQLMNAEDYLYEAHALGIKDKVFDEVRKLRKDNPHMLMDDIYQTALEIVKNNKKICNQI